MEFEKYLTEWLKTNKNLAALNVALAEETVHKQTLSVQAEIRGRARKLLSGRTSKKFSDYLFSNAPTSIEAYGFYVLAMIEIDINPTVPGFTSWARAIDPFSIEHEFKAVEEARILIWKSINA